MELLLSLALGLSIWLLLPAGRDAALPGAVRDHAAASTEDGLDEGGDRGPADPGDAPGDGFVEL